MNNGNDTPDDSNDLARQPRTALLRIAAASLSNLGLLHLPGKWSTGTFITADAALDSRKQYWVYQQGRVAAQLSRS